MKNIWTIARRDFRAYFTSPIAYIVIAGFMVIMGWMFFFNLAHFNLQNMQYQQFNMGKGVEHHRRHHPAALRQHERHASSSWCRSSRCGSSRKRRKQHTIELLMTSPVTLDRDHPGQVPLGLPARARDDGC